MNQVCLDTARLLTQVAPLVFAGNVFALKGGTAINLFVRDMPRLSVDLDRQLARDLFDVMELFRHEGITPAIRRSFVAYPAAHNRPIHEVLFPNLRDVSGEYEGTFKGMTAEPVALKVLLATRERMVKELQAGLDAAEREFLVSLAKNEPKWDLLGIAHLEQMPGVRWKLENLGRLAKANPKKLKSQAEDLERQLAK